MSLVTEDEEDEDEDEDEDEGGGGGTSEELETGGSGIATPQSHKSPLSGRIVVIVPGSLFLYALKL
jgi:hypothetical protein